jgi:5-methylcytosine-specific restriction endonuclease McrA
MPEPTPQFQLEFIDRIQRLLDSGSFVATYKYALLIALCNVAAESGHDDMSEQIVPLRDLGRQFLAQYWTHAREYPQINRQLRQNTGQRAAILGIVGNAREHVAHPDHADAAGSVPEKFLKQAVKTVETMPLFKLQTIGLEKADPDHPDNFLYPTRKVDDAIVLRPGVSACLRRFRGLIVSSTQAAWSDYIRRNNPELGVGHDLEVFLFGSNRTGVHALAEPLLDLQKGRCFYTGRPMKDTVHVDHFIPWSKYPLDSPFNLVAASSTANLKKSDHLAALPHLQRWHRRNADQRSALAEIGRADEFRRSLDIACFTYGTAARLGTMGWLGGNRMEALHGWEAVLTTPA